MVWKDYFFQLNSLNTPKMYLKSQFWIWIKFIYFHYILIYKRNFINLDLFHVAGNSHLLWTWAVSLYMNDTSLEQNTNPNVKISLDLVNCLNIIPQYFSKGCPRYPWSFILCYCIRTFWKIEYNKRKMIAYKIIN